MATMPICRRLVERAIAAGAVNSAIATGRKMLRDATAQLELVPPGRYRDALDQSCRDAGRDARPVLGSGQPDRESSAL